MNNNKLLLSLGTDPEWMIQDRIKKRVVNAIPIIGHGKDDPLDMGDGFKIYSDNVLVEVSMPPANDKKGFMANMLMALAKVTEVLDPRYQLLARAAVEYHDAELGPKPKADDLNPPEAWRIGCTPNFNGYTGECNPTVPFEDGTRTGSFHLHIGNRNWKLGTDQRLLSPASKHKAVRLMDIFVGCSAVIVSSDTTAKLRRKLYGKAGEFRPTPYGIEYRVLENFFTRQPDLTELMLDLTEHAMSFIENDTADALLAKIDPKLVQKAINHDDTTLAERILTKADISVDMGNRITAAQWLGKSPNPAEGWGLGGAS